MDTTGADIQGELARTVQVAGVFPRGGDALMALARAEWWCLEHTRIAADADVPNAWNAACEYVF
jgi:hypothetical protein